MSGAEAARRPVVQRRICSAQTAAPKWPSLLNLATIIPRAASLSDSQCIFFQFVAAAIRFHCPDVFHFIARTYVNGLLINLRVCQDSRDHSFPVRILKTYKGVW